MMPSAPHQFKGRFATRGHWRPLEVLFWVAAFASYYLFPGKHLILTEIAILALFALSLDLILGYAGIVSLGHAAFFGFGAYVAGLLGQASARGRTVACPVAGGLGGDAAGLRHQLPGATRLGSDAHHG